MATEALVTDQTAQGHVEEVKLTDEVAKIVEKDTPPESKDLKEKDDEKTKVDDSTSVEATATKLEDAIMPEETQEDNKVETAIKEVEKEGSESAKDGTSKQDADSLISDSKEEAAVEPATEAAVEDLKDQVEVANISEPPKQTVEEAADVSGEKLVQETVAETAKDPEAPEVAAKEVNTAPEAAAEVVNTSVEAEVNTIPEIVAETENPTPEKAGEEVSKTEEAEPAKEELQVTGLVVNGETVKKSLGDFFSVKLEENIESSKEELPVADLSKPEEVSHPEAVACKIKDAVVSVAPVKDLLKEEAERADATEVDQNASGNAEKIVSIDTDPVAESTKTVVKPEDKVEQEMQERTVVAEEPIASDRVEADAATEVSLEASATVEVSPLSSEGETASESVEDRKNESVEGEKPASVETSRDINAKGEKTDVEVPPPSFEGEKASESVEEKKNESVEGEKPASVETSRDINAEGEKTEKDAAEAPKEEVAIKSSQRQSNNIFSKVKQSMVKVKKAIIGKSPSSKTMSAEGKDEIKVK